MDAPHWPSSPTEKSNQVGKLLHFEIDGVRVEAIYQPADELGGDLYEILNPIPGRLRVVIGDICGRGAQAARWVERVRPVVREAAGSAAHPVEVVERINAELCRVLPDDVFVTLALLEIEVFEKRLLSVNAGHVPALVRHAQDEPVIFGHASGPPLGMLSSARYSLASMRLDPGDVIILMTDGVLESVEPDLLGMENLVSLLAHGGELGEMCRSIWSKALRSSRRPDDLTWIGMQLLPVAAMERERQVEPF